MSLTAKLLEVRDKATFVPVLAVVLFPDNAEQSYLLRRTGYGAAPSRPPVMLTRLDGGGEARNCPADWADRTFSTAHKHIEFYFDELEDGDVVDVEFILGETTEKKRSERHGC